MTVSITDQLLMVCPTVSPKYSSTSQNPASLTWEKNSEPRPDGDPEERRDDELRAPRRRGGRRGPGQDQGGHDAALGRATPCAARASAASSTTAATSFSAPTSIPGSPASSGSRVASWLPSRDAGM
jgi:hypothetical protein